MTVPVVVWGCLLAAFAASVLVGWPGDAPAALRRLGECERDIARDTERGAARVSRPAPGALEGRADDCMTVLQHREVPA